MYLIFFLDTQNAYIASGMSWLIKAQDVGYYRVFRGGILGKY